MPNSLAKVTKLICTHKPTTSFTTGNDASAAVSISGWQSARAILTHGATTGDAVISLTITSATASGGSYNTVTGTTTATVLTTTGLKDGLLVVTVDKFLPTQTHIKTNVHRNTANSQHGGCILELYNPITVPTTDDSTSMLVAQKLVQEAT